MGGMGFLRRGGPQGTRYTMREKLFSIGDDFWIENDAGDSPARSVSTR
jgi:hypothetical protein